LRSSRAALAVDGSGGAIHDFEYDDAWYPTTDGGGFSLVIRDVNADSSVWDRRAVGAPVPSPAARRATRSSRSAATAALCTPGEMNESGSVYDGSTHLEGYKIKEAPGVPKHLPHLGIRLESVFGPIVVDTKPRVDRLLVPTAVSETGPVPAPDPASHDVDHYKCYAATLSKLAPDYFPRSAQAHFAGGFDAADFDLRRPSRVCSPVEVDGEGVENDEGWLVCYPAKVDKFSPKHVKRSGVDAANQFGDWLLDTIKEEELCVPSRLVGGL
jgi:hypothetical protein